MSSGDSSEVSTTRSQPLVAHSGKIWQLEIQAVLIGIQGEVHQQIAGKAGGRYRQAVGVVPEVRVAQVDAVQLDAGPPGQLLQAEMCSRGDTESRMNRSRISSLTNRWMSPCCLEVRPVEPADFVVLAIGVVVAVLGAPDLVAHQDHRRTQRQEGDGEEVLDLPIAELPRSPGHRSALRPRSCWTEVVVGAVPVVLAVGLVVLGVVGDQIVEREPVVAGHEVDALLGFASLVGVQVGAARAAGWQRRGTMSSSPRTKARTSSRNWPFHSFQLSPMKWPTW